MNQRTSCAKILGVTDKNGVKILRCTPNQGFREETIPLDTFNEEITLEPPPCGYSNFNGAIIYSYIRSERQNGYNYLEPLFSISVMPEVFYPNDVAELMPAVFFPQYMTPENLLKKLREGDVLGGAISSILGIGIGSSDLLEVFYCGSSIGKFDLDRNVFILAKNIFSWKTILSEAFPNIPSIEVTT